MTKTALTANILLIIFNLSVLFGEAEIHQTKAQNPNVNTEYKKENGEPVTGIKDLPDKTESPINKKNPLETQDETPLNSFSINTYLSYNDMKHFSQKNPFYILSAFLLAYPDKIIKTGYDFKNKDWFLITKTGKLFFWAKGRLLPEKIKNEYNKYKPYVFYLYPETPYSRDSFSEKDIEYFKSDYFLKNRNKELDYEFSFYNEVFGVYNRWSVEQNMETVYIFGNKTSVNKNIKEPLEKALAEINREAQQSEDVKKFVNSIKDVHGYNWRKIRDSDAMSYHSLALAFDLVPENWDTQTIYWNWTRFFEEDWVILPPEERWSPPQEVIEIFEKHGFIWGGKWDLWDNMHFEYRPELLILQNLLKKGEDKK